MSIYTTRSGATEHPESMLDFLTSRLIKKSGVLNLASDLIVSAQASPNMSVQVSAGYGLIAKSDFSKTYPVYSSAVETVNVGNNSSGNTRIDALVCYIDLSAVANATATNVATLDIVQGTPAGSPVAPDDAAIKADIGAANPYIVLANITVANGAIAITAGNIADVRPRCTSLIKNDEYIVEADGATVTFDINESNKQTTTLGGNRTLALSNVQAGDVFYLKLVQDGTGSRTVTWFSTVTWLNGTPVLTTTGAGIDAFLFIAKSPTTFDGIILSQSGLNLKELQTDFSVEHNSDGTHNLSGIVTIDGTSSASAGIKLAEDTDNGTAYMAIVAPAAVTTNTTLVLPDGAGNSGEVLMTNGSGTLSWGIPTPAGIIVMWSGSIASIPTGWLLCDGSNSTPDLRDRFIIGAGSTYAVAATGGSKDAIVVAHTHTGTTDTFGGFEFSGSSSHSTTMNYGMATNQFSSNSNLGAHSHAFTTASTGSSGTNANLPPYYALAYIMKS